MIKLSTDPDYWQLGQQGQLNILPMWKRNIICVFCVLFLTVAAQIHFITDNLRRSIPAMTYRWMCLKDDSSVLARRFFFFSSSSPLLQSKNRLLLQMNTFYWLLPQFISSVLSFLSLFFLPFYYFFSDVFIFLCFSPCLFWNPSCSVLEMRGCTFAHEHACTTDACLHIPLSPLTFSSGFLTFHVFLLSTSFLLFSPSRHSLLAHVHTWTGRREPLFGDG